MKKRLLRVCMYAALAAMIAPALAGCGGDGGSSSDVTNPPVTEPPVTEPPVTEPPAVTVPTFAVVDSAGEPVVGATVFAVPVADVEALAAQPITLTDGNYTVEALTVDEPLEDLVNGNFTPSGSGVATYKSAVTDSEGKAELADLPTGETDRFFIYVAPAADDSARLPGGSLCREAVTGASLDDKVTNIAVSTRPSSAATFVGTSSCLVCHPEQEGVKKTMHRNGFMAPGAPSALQDLSEFDSNDAEYDLGAALGKYTDGIPSPDYDTPGTGGTTVYFYDWDGSRKFDKWKTFESAQASGTLYATVRIFRDTNDGKYKAEFKNIINSSDPNGLQVHEIVLTYGGGIYKQRPITKIDDSLFMVPLQFNARGDDASGDRVQKIWRDYHLDWWMNVADANGDKIADDPATSTFKVKPAANNSVDVQCAPCHFNGYQVSKNETTGYYSASGVADGNGEPHPVTGEKQELNIGCETCHGPGSEHVAAAGMGKAIVSPQNLTPERASMICGQCHSRPQGNDSFGIKKDSPLDQNNRMMTAGTSRADFLANNTSRDDASAGDLWGDGLHSKSHHQQYTDFIQTSKYRNGAKLLTCASCHDLHGPGTDRHQLSGVSDGTLCTSCHAGVVNGDHQVAMTGSSLHASGPAKCVECHNAKVSSSGAGINPISAKVGGTSGKTFYHGDISSHLFDVPTKADSSTGMPVPFTNTCGACHGMNSL